MVKSDKYSTGVLYSEYANLNFNLIHQSHCYQNKILAFDEPEKKTLQVFHCRLAISISMDRFLVKFRKNDDGEQHEIKKNTT